MVATAKEGEIEPTPEMIEAGVERLWTHRYGHEPSEDEARILIRDIFLAMARSERARSKESEHR
jgi:hypothetical protein